MGDGVMNNEGDADLRGHFMGENRSSVTEMTSARFAKRIRSFAAALDGSPEKDAQETRRIALNLIGASSHA